MVAVGQVVLPHSAEISAECGSMRSPMQRKYAAEAVHGARGE